MKAYFEDLWERLPEELEPPDVGPRLAFMLGEAESDDVALDLGCGDGSLTARLAPAVARVIGAEVAQAAVQRAAARHPEVQFRLVALDGPLPFAGGEFTLVLSSEVIEHVADTGRWLNEVRRVLAPGGRLLLTTPNHGRLRLLAGGIERYSEPLGDHLHLYTRRSLAGLLDAFGFHQVTVSTAAGPPLMRRRLLARAVR